MSQRDLARAVDVAESTLINFETGTRKPYRRTIAAIRGALEAAGVEFLEGDGVRLRPG